MKRSFLLSLALLSPLVVYSQDKAEVNGYFDFYYQTSPQAHSIRPPTSAGPRGIEGRYFDRTTNQFTLNMAEISIKKKQDKATVRIDFAGGEMVDQMSGGGLQSTVSNNVNPSANEPTRNVMQAILTYQLNEKLSLQMGKFYSPIGLEVPKAKDNWQFSRAYLFNYGPFWHQGVALNYAFIPGTLSSTIYIVNAWDGRISEEANQSQSVILNFNFVPSAGSSVNYNYMSGAETINRGKRELHELNAIVKLSEMYLLGIDAQTATQSEVTAVEKACWSGVALYAKATVTPIYSLSARYEKFDDSQSGFAISGGLVAVSSLAQKINAVTLTNTFLLSGNVEARIELRSDRSDSDQFFKRGNGSATNNQESVAAGFLFSF